MMPGLLSWTVALSWLIVQCTSSATPSPPIRVRVQASWDAAPLIVQILETAALENPSSFFTHLEAFTSSQLSPDESPLSPSLSDEQVYTRAEALLFAAEQSESRREASLESFRLALSIREASPLIETRSKLYYASTNTTVSDERPQSSAIWQGEAVDDISDLRNRLDNDNTQLWNGQAPSVYPFDLEYPSPSPSTTLPLAILYADLSSDNFLPLHSYLARLCREQRIRYIFRWKPFSGQGGQQSKLMLSGYGAGLDLKRVDYITIDDRDMAGGGEAAVSEYNGADKGRTPALREDLAENSIFRSSAEETNELVQVKPAEMEHIGLRASQFIASSDSPLSVLRRLSQDFPKHAHKLAARIPVLNDSFVSEMQEVHQTYVGEGKNMIFMNGLLLREKDLKPFTLLKKMRKERKTVASIMALGLNSTQAIDILSHSAIGAAFATEAGPASTPRGMMISIDSLGEFFDASDRQESSQAILYWNNVEKDTRYQRWNPSLQGLLQMGYPGSLPQVRKNLINVVLVLDLGKRDSHAIIGDNVSQFISMGLPIRWGLVPQLRRNKAEGQDDTGEKVARVMLYLVKKAGRAAAMTFSRELVTSSGETFSMTDLRAAYSAVHKAWKASQQAEEAAADDILDDFDKISAAELPEIDAMLDASRQYGRRLGVSAGTDDEGLGHFFVNGKYSLMDEDFRTTLQTSMNQQLQYLTQQFYMQGIDETIQDVSTFFYDQPSTYSSRNPFIFPSEDKSPLRFVSLPEIEEATGVACSQGNDAKFSVWLFVGADYEAGKELLAAVETYTAQDATTRFCVVPNPREAAVEKDLPKYAYATSSTQSAEKGQAAARMAGFGAGASGLLINGRVIGELPKGSFSAADIAALVAYERTKRLDPLTEAVRDALSDESETFSQLPALSSLISQAYAAEPTDAMLTRSSVTRSRQYLGIPGEHISFSIGNESTALFQFGVILDPLSETAQIWSALLETLAELQSIHIKLYLNPVETVTEMPLKRFYRYSFNARPHFDTTGSEVVPSLLFEDVPPSTLLTLAMDVQSSWQAFPKESIHDLDNIRLSDLKPSRREAGVDALFQLDNIIVEGHAREALSGVPPRGLQLQLVDEVDPNTSTNTLVMANLGYHQLKANPGIWQYSIRVGRSSEVFELDVSSIGGTSQIAVTSFEGVTIFPKFTRKSGMEGIDLLNEDEEAVKPVELRQKAADLVGGIRNRMQSFFGSAPVKDTSSQALTTTASKGAAINIFTVASGLLYERMAMLMILSVLRHTESSVKFWFINNFLSPSFKALIPHLAKEYGFDYELITYTWPHWLRQQKEKQRTIWGYKILFLDVLFPLELERVIFVDSDQIVRTDLKELIDMDLEGAPYAYTPMGDDRPEMEGFRFWKTGYWRDHLRGRPYHISALYVIDLNRFRQIAAGDRLRGQYQALSADPNSLSNLDQDLPNNMQHQIPIHSLDPSWLWCETWCSSDRLSEAKTIDLCQNPLNKEQKLTMAKRIIPEWTIYDKEIADFAARVAEEQRQAVKQEGAQADVGEAGAFAEEATQLQQAKMQQLKYEEETASTSAGERGEVHTKDEL